jgi:hypothetical protein
MSVITLVSPASPTDHPSLNPVIAYCLLTPFITTSPDPAPEAFAYL